MSDPSNICDRCGSARTDNPFSTVDVTSGPLRFVTALNELELCADCASAFVGWLRELKRDELPPEPNPHIEALLADLRHSLMGEPLQPGNWYIRPGNN